MKEIAKNSDYMKKQNRLNTINIIRKREVSRADLSRKTGLTRSAITLIVNTLIEEGIVCETSIGQADYGRKPIHLDINGDRFYTIGLDISRDHCYLGAINFKGKLICKEAVSIEAAQDAQEALDIISDHIANIQRMPELKGELLGLGISVPGPIDIKNGTILNPPKFNKWHHVEIVKYLQRTFDFPIFLNNNAIAQTLVEKNYGIGTSYHNYLVIMINAGIGSGIIINDKLYRGVDGFGNEIGHITVDINGPKCDCGNFGCLELYAGLSAVVNDNKRFGFTSWPQIVDQAIEGDEKCQGIIKREALYLSTAIVTCLNMLELEAVIIKGDIGYRPELLLKSIQDFVWSRTITRDFRDKTPIQIVPMIEDHEIIAAASIVVEQFYKGEITSEF